MAGLVAVIAAEPRSGVPEGELERLADSYEAVRGSATRRTASGGGAEVAIVARAESPNAGLDVVTGSWTAYVGRPQAAGAAGERPPHAWDGQFALVSFDETAGEVTVASDPLGMQAVYVAERGGLLFVSTSALALARHLRATPNRFAIETFFRVGLHFGALTHWDGISRLEPATLIRIGSGGMRRETYWRPSVDRELEGSAIEIAAERCADGAAVAMGRYASPGRRYSCDITGGWDSRLLSLLLRRAGLDLVVNTVGPVASVDVQLGQRVAAAAGWEWWRESLPSDWPERLPDASQFALGWGDGQLEVTQLAAVLHHHAARASKVDVQFSGGGGEHWRYYGWLQEFPRGGTSTRANIPRLVNNVGYLKAMDLVPLKIDPTPAVRDDLIRRLRAYAAPHGDLPKQFQLDALYGYKSMGHYGAYLSASRGVLAVELPFYLRDVFSLSFSVAPRHRNYHRFMRELMELLDPGVAAVPTTNGGPALPFSIRRAPLFVPYVRDHARRIAKQLTKNLPGPTIGAVPLRSEDEMARGRRQLLEQWITKPRTEWRSGPLYSFERMHELMRAPRALDDSWPILGRIITVEMALEAVDAAID